MRRSVVIAGIVVAAMSVAPTTASADVRPAADEVPADCRPAGPDPQDGSGTGDTGGADRQEASGEDEPGESGNQEPGEKPADGEPGGSEPDVQEPAGDASDQRKSGGDEPGETKPGGDEPGEAKSAGDEPGETEPAGDEPGETKSAGDEPGEAKPAGDAPDERKPAGDEPDGQEPGGNAAQGAEPAECPAPGAGPAEPGAAAGADTSAATIHDWGTPNRVDEFDGDLSNWSIYDGEGHAGNGRRSPEAASVKDGILTIDGDSDGTTAGMAWNPGQKYGRWEGRVRAPESDESYNALLLLWPDAEDFPVGGEIDFMEMTDHLRQETELFLHYGADNSQVQGKVKIDATQWHNWAVEWTPEKVTAYVDGKEWWSTTDTSILPPGPMHLCIQLDWFPDNGSGGEVTPSKMEVDWVRQYSLPEGEQGGDDEGGASEGLLDAAGQTLDRLVRRTEGAPDPVQPAGVTGTP